MSNLRFFKEVFSNELDGTIEVIRSLPSPELNYKPHARNRSAREIIEHLLCHLADLKEIATQNICEEAIHYDFQHSLDAADQYRKLAGDVLFSLTDISEEQWENEAVELFVNKKLFVKLPRSKMMWFFLFDIIHHRGQLTTYIRPMGGKNPVVYGYSADSQ